MRCAIFTHVVHQLKHRAYEAYPPYVREMNLWLKHCSEVEIVAPLSLGTTDLQGQGYEHPYINFTSIPSINFLSFSSSVWSIIKIPWICYRIIKVMQRAEHLHLRCPGNTGLLASVLQIFFPEKPKTAKYAGNWDPAAARPLSYRVQQWILHNRFLTRNMKVLIYGEWSYQSKNIRSFMTATFSEKDIDAVPEKKFSPPFVFLFAGNLKKGKGALSAIELIRDLRIGNINARLIICGDGPERENLENNGKEELREGSLKFMGILSLEDLKKEYRQAHFLILPSKTEGWPKVVAEAMFFGCIPITTAVSCVPWMLGEGERGLLFSFGSSSVERFFRIETITGLLNDQQRMQRMSAAAKKWSQHYTLEQFELGITAILKN